MKMKVLVSIIVPVYQVKKYLRACLNALLIQDGIYPYEVILVDDGSKDGSGKICDEYVLKYPKIFKVIHQKNQGLPLARNAGLAIAKGEWIAFCDSDDIPSHDFILALYHTVSAHRKCDVGVMGYNLLTSDGKEKKGLSTRSGFLSGDMAASALLNDISIRSFVWTKIFRKSMLDHYKIRFYSHNLHFEDLPFCFAALLVSNEVAFTKKSSYTYREGRKGSIMQVGMNGKRMQCHINSYYACRAFYDSLYGAEKGSEFFKKKKKRIAFALLGDVPASFKKVGDIGFTKRLADAYKSLKDIDQKELPVYGAPWEQNVLDYSPKLDTFVGYKKTRSK